MTDETPRTEAGRALLEEFHDEGLPPDFLGAILAIEAEAARVPAPADRPVPTLPPPDMALIDTLTEGADPDRPVVIQPVVPAPADGPVYVTPDEVQAVLDEGLRTGAITPEAHAAIIVPAPADGLDVERLGHAMHIRLGHPSKYGSARCRCWGEARALAGVYGNLTALEAGKAGGECMSGWRDGHQDAIESRRATR